MNRSEGSVMFGTEKLRYVCENQPQVRFSCYYCATFQSKNINHKGYSIFRTIGHTFFYALAELATYTQVQLV